MEESGQLHATAILAPGKEPLVTVGKRLSGPQSRPGRGGEEKNSEPLSELNPPPDHPALSPALYH